MDKPLNTVNKIINRINVLVGENLLSPTTRSGAPITTQVHRLL